ncbi:MAG: hypothetical protein IJF66_02265 [Clostridia bacterium]|nr:hypothetical protein [Clostridia bacterium]
MKKYSVKKLIAIIVLVCIMIVSLVPALIPTTVSADGSYFMGSFERDDMEQADFDKMNDSYRMEEAVSAWASDIHMWTEETYEWTEGVHAWVENKKVEKEIEDTANWIKTANGLAKTQIPALISIIQTKEGEDFDTAGLIDNVLSTASGIAYNIPPYGPIVGAAIDLTSTLFTLIMGGEEPPSATAIMQDNMMQEFSKISDQIAGLEHHFGDLSNQIDENTNEIIQEMNKAFDIAEAKSVINEFYFLSGEYDFSYSQYRNYLYGTSDNNNSDALTAYYSLLLNAQLNGASPEELRYLYNELYSALMNNREAFKSYVVGTEVGKSIVQYYYDVLVAHPEYVKDKGLSPQLAAVQFAYDLYQTHLLAEQLMLTCNNYQYTQMLLNETASYDYGSGTIWKSSIEGEEGKEALIYSQAIKRNEEFTKQFAEDIAYILGVNSTYTTKINEKIYLMNTEEVDGVVCGKVPFDSIVYLNRVPTSVCELFEIDPEDYQYIGDCVIHEDGTFRMTSSKSDVYLTYQGEIVSSIHFVDSTKTSTFSGGSGTAEDPYLISNAEQFWQINEGLDKYYRLIDDIDFEWAERVPIGREELSNGSFKYYEFTGIIDGNGYKLKNLTIKQLYNLENKVLEEDFAGLIGIIGQKGVVKNLTLQDVNVDISITKDDIQYSNNEYHAGIIAGNNKGVIRNCHILSAKSAGTASLNLTSTTSNDGANRRVNFYAGGITGKNEGVIQFATISKTTISVSSTHNFAGADTDKNKNMVYVGGICGYNWGNILCVIVKDSTSVDAYAKSFYNHDNTVNPYVTSLAGGIVGENYQADLSNIQYVYSEATTVGRGEIDCASLWGEHYQNRIQGGSPYIPLIEDIEKIKSDEETIASAFPKVSDLNVASYDTTEFYSIGDKSPDFKKIKVTLNGDELKLKSDEQTSVGGSTYEVLELYGFDTSIAGEKSVTMLLIATIDESKHLLTTNFTVKVEDCIVDISVDILNKYEYGAELPDTVTVVERYASGTTVVVQNVDFDIENKSEITKQPGVHDVVFLYEGIDKIISINVSCPHLDCQDYSNTDLYEYIDTVDPTCQVIGYDLYQCIKCGEEIKTNYKPMTDHKIVEEIEIPATCSTEGMKGAVYCDVCDIVFTDSSTIPMLKHSIVMVGDVSWPNKIPNENGHYCENENVLIPHSYIVTENSGVNGIVYTYICGDCGWKSEITDTNIVTKDGKLQPTVVVSDGYALAPGDLVTVYVQLVNNPGVTGAQFGIRYDASLTLVECSDGRLFEKIFNNTDEKFIVADSKPTKVSCGYNFVWEVGSAKDAKGELVHPDGNLVKLVFKLPSNATTEDKYTVSVVYSNANGTIGGFNIDGMGDTVQDQRQFITKEGVIRLVEGEDHLPGDINGDKCVDLLDIVILANYLVDDESAAKLEAIKKYADVNLDGYVTNADLRKILLSLTGEHGNTGNLLYYKYQLALNTNGYSTTDIPKQIDVVLGSSTYASLNEYTNAISSRPGYKFLGWYTRLDCDCNEKECEHLVSCSCEVADECTHTFIYDHNQKIQTLYARWELNKLVFDVNGAPSGEILDIYYSEEPNITVPNNPKKEYNVAFVSDKKQNEGATGVLEYAFKYWQGDNGKQYATLDDAINDLLYSHYGVVTLTAVWDDNPSITYPDWTIDGYEEKIDWFINDTYHPNAKIEEPADILKGTIHNEYYYIFAQHKPIVYFIEVDFNGGTGTLDDSVNNSDKGYSVDTPYNLAGIDASYSGRELTGWKVYIGTTCIDSYKVSSKIGYIPTVKTGDKITIQAQWDEKQYEIELILNGGVLSGDAKIIYYADEIDNIYLPVPEYPEYPQYNRFVGWYTDESLAKGKEFHKETLEPGAIDRLYAKWDLCDKPYYNYTDTPSEITGNRVIVDWSADPTGASNNNKEFLINGVSEIYFIGKSNIEYDIIISFMSGITAKTTPTVHFVNFNMNGYLRLATERNSLPLEVTLECIGEKNSIIAPIETTAISGFTSLMIKGSGNLNVKGGDGVSATTEGGAGTDGAIAIIVGNLTIDMEGSLTVVGGNGGAGKAGTNASTSGASGGNGGNGGNGAVPVNCTTINAIQFNSCSFVCGDGGDGGAGGSGAAGLVGRMDLGYKNYRNGGAGGAGGSGGNGGNAGYSTQLIDLLKNTAISLDLGEGGDGGVGGRGGNGGNGGPDIGTFYVAEPYGLNGGDGGVGGRGGNGGNGRVAGFGGAAGESGKGGKGTSEGWIGGTKKGTTGKTPESLGAGTDGMTLQYP